MKLYTYLRHFFVAHEHNNYKPHIFREVAVVSIIVVSIFLLGASFGSSFFIHRTVLGASVASSVLVDMANETRLAYNEAPLVRSTTLDRAATLKGEDMASKGYFAHNSPDGVTPWHWFKEAGYSFLYAGENLAIDFTESSDVQTAWMNSPLHRANLLDVHFREVGIATVEGVYQNRSTIYVVQMFGTPAVASAESTQSDTVVNIEKKSKPESTSPVAEKNIDISNASTSTVLGEVKGDTVEASTTATTAPVATSSPIQQVYTTPEFAVARNPQGLEQMNTTATSAPQYSTWYQKIVFGGSSYVDIIYRVMILLVIFSLGTMFILEYRKEHWKHIAYGLFILLLLIALSFVNEAFF